jgi:hypothetical protein
VAHPAHLCPARVHESGHAAKVSHVLQGIITTSTGVLARSSTLLLCNGRACNLKPLALYSVTMTSRFPTAAEILSFPAPNYADPTTLRPLAIGVVTPITALVVAFISCRFYSRTVLTKTLGWDDGIMLLAAVSFHGPIKSFLLNQQITCVGNNLMVIISMLPQYRMGYHLCTQMNCMLAGNR